jgi:hypothetical protein
MERKATLVLPKELQDQLHAHLFQDDKEAAALLVCTPVGARRLKLLVREIVPVPHAACASRRHDAITWPGEYVEIAIDKAELNASAIIAVHSHPRGCFDFSAMDDASDRILMPALFHGTGQIAGSAVMIPGGALRARLYQNGEEVSPIDLVMSVGDDLALWWNDGLSGAPPAEPPVAFTNGMTRWLNRMSACVIGVSGTGSVVAEQLARLGFGEIILIDFDKLEYRNLDRILNATIADVGTEALKVEMFAAAIERYRSGCEVITVPRTIADRESILAACEADVLFSCVDTAEGRHIADRIGSWFALPLFDVGVSVSTREDISGRREIAEVCGRIDYVYPSGSRLQDRGVYGAGILEAEYLAQVAPSAYRAKVADGYLKGLEERAPAVITLNMRAASACAMEFIARAFPFRHDPNASRARTVFMLADGDEECCAEATFPLRSNFPVSVGAREPLLGLPAFAKSMEV